MLDPDLVDAFRANASELIAEVAANDPRQLILEIEPEPRIEKESSELPDIARAFGDVVDLKTPHTHGHSGGVATLAGEAARLLRVDEATRAKLNVAALLHDVGRIGVSNAIWEKPGPLTSAEWERVRMHPYHSERILAGSSALEPMARIAGMHHERLDGSGYYRSCQGSEISMACRVLAAADCFQAMTQPRPIARRWRGSRRVGSSPTNRAPASWTPTRSRRCSRRPGSGGPAAAVTSGRRAHRARDRSTATRHRRLL